MIQFSDEFISGLEESEKEFLSGLQQKYHEQYTKTAVQKRIEALQKEAEDGKKNKEWLESQFC